MPNIDYTSRDYTSLREDLIRVVQQRIPSWTATDPADVGLALVEAFAYLGDVTSYYTDRVLNEAYLPTATQRQSILDISRMLGYTPTTAMPAVIGSFRVSNPTARSERIFTGSQFTCNVLEGGIMRRAVFEVQLDTALLDYSNNKSLEIPSNGSVTVRATQGDTTYQQSLGVSDGSADQEFVIPTANLIENSLVVASGVIAGYGGASQQTDPLYGYARYGETIWDAGPIAYNRSVGIASAMPTDGVYTLIMDADSVRIRFGDGVNGRIPPKDHKIYVTYRTGGGRFGNVPSGTRFSGPSNLVGEALSDGFGGSDYESNASIRRNAASTFRSRNRAVTQRDFQDLAITFAGVAKANARANNATQVTVYIAPQSSGGYPAPGYYASTVAKRYRASSGVATLVLSSIPANVKTATASSGTSSGSTRTITTTADHGFTAGRTITVLTGDSNYDGTFTIKSTASRTFTYDHPSISTSSAATLTTTYLTEGTMTVSGVNSAYDKANTGFTLIPADSANVDTSSNPRPTVKYSTTTLSAEGGAGASAVASAGVVTTGEDQNFTDLRSNVETFLEDRSSAGTNVVVIGPDFVDVTITATIYVEPTVTQSAAMRAAKNALFGLFDYESIGLGTVLTKPSLAVTLSKLSEIGYATIDVMAATSNGTNVDTLSLSSGQIPRLLSGSRSESSPYTASGGVGTAKDTYTEGNLILKIGASTGIADLGTA